MLDVGAGAGRHNLALQEAGREVTAIDICPSSADILRDRGVREVEIADVFAYQADTGFDTSILHREDDGNYVAALTGSAPCP